MNRFNKREQNIIILIANSIEGLTGKALALKLNLSLRTIQNEISKINSTLDLIKSSNKGYEIIEENYKALNFSYSNNLSYEHRILKEIFMNNESQRIDELAENFYLSVSALDKILKSFNPLLSQYDLSIIRDKGMINVKGTELNKRHFISFLFFEESNTSFNSLNNLKCFFPDMNIDDIQSLIYITIISHEYYIENTYLSNLIVNLTIALYRMINNHYIDEQYLHTYKIYSEAEYEIATTLCLKVADNYKIKPTKADIEHIASLFSGSIKPNIISCDKKYNTNLSKKFVRIIDNILQDAFNYYMLDVDYSLCLYNFSFHIDAMIKRITNQQPANNEILYSIKNSSPFIHDVSVHISRKLEEQFHISIPDSEIGFISAHIGYLIENAISHKNKIYILLLCKEYSTTVDRIKEKLIDRLPDWVEIITNNNIQKKSVSIRADIVITTSPIKFAGKKTICISPFFTEKDFINVDRAIHCCLDEKNKNYYNHLLSSLFHENLFFKCNDLIDKKKAIEFMGNKLVEFGVVEKGFVDSVFRREKLSSTCFLDSFAIPHAIELNANKTMICVLLSDNGIKWDNHSIHIVLMIAIKQEERKQFVELYDGIVETLNNPEKIKSLVSAGNYIEFINFLKK